MNNNTKCIICLCMFENEQDFSERICPCSDSSHVFCKECLIQYIENIISNTSHGICPIITCPYPHDGIKSILLYEKWNHLISFSILSKYRNIANALISTICGQCHIIKPLICLEYVPCHNDSPFISLIHSFSNGSISINNFYQAIFISTLNSEKPMGNNVLFHKIQYILTFISNPERKTSLYLRFLKDFPRIFTACCNTEQCFQCRVSPFHHGKTCAEINTTELDHSIVLCPNCSLQLTKGDGCNHVTCVCGNCFNWKTEKELCEKCQKFKMTYPKKTSFECAKVLCSKTSTPLEILYAKAWRKKHLAEVNTHLYDWFKSTYSPFPSQTCATLMRDNSKIYGIKHASKLWYTINKTEVDKYTHQIILAIKSIFPTFFPIVERPVTAYTILHDVSSSFTKYDTKILESVNLWIHENPQLYQDGALHSELQKTISFLYLYGKYTPVEINQTYVPPSSWDRIRSNPSLLYTNDNLTVERICDTSRYPTVFSSQINTITSTFRIQLDQFPTNNNWFSFGISANHMQNSYSDGVGKTQNSWGIISHRISSVNRFHLFANGVQEGCFRVLQENDILSIYINILEGWFEIFINDTDRVHRFRIPKVSLDLSNYYFTMTLANDNKISILTPDLGSNLMDSKISEFNVLHEEHQPLFFSFLKIIRQLYQNQLYQNQTKMNARLMCIIKIYNTQLDEMENKFTFVQDEDTMDTYIQYLLFNPNDNNTGIYSWGNIFHFIYRKYKYRLEQQRQKKKETAHGFRNSFEKDAPFIAALYLKHYYDAVETKTNDIYVAYMNTFPDEQHDWYKSNSLLQTPIIENIAPNCNCLPRHLIQCSVCN